MDRGAWQATVCGVPELDTTEHTQTHDDDYLKEELSNPGNTQ